MCPELKLCLLADKQKAAGKREQRCEINLQSSEIQVEATKVQRAENGETEPHTRRLL